MTSHGEVLHSFNYELEKSLESIKERRINVMNEIANEEAKRKEIEEQIAKIRNELYTIDSLLESKYELKNEYEKVIFNSETAFKKILENSKTLHHIIRKDEHIIMKKINDNKEL